MSLAIDCFNIEQICDRVVSRARGYIPHKPHKKQAEYLALPDLEALYGGAAGGGKSDALLMAALEHVDKPGYAALILRRTFRDLNQPDAIMHRAHDWLRGTDAKWSDRDKRYTFPSTATLTFGYLDNENDKGQYASAAFQFVGWDELTHFPENWYLFLFSRLRRLEGSHIPLRVRGATNPGSLGHAWVHRRFVDKETAVAPFVPALLDDNPYIDQEGYRESLSKLDAITRDQLERGVWRSDASGLVYSYAEAKNIILRAPACKHHALGMDYGLTRDSCAFTVIGWNDNDPTVYILRSYKRDKMIPSAAAEEAQALAGQFTFRYMIGDANGMGRSYVEEGRRRFKLPIESADKTNKRGYISLFNGAMENSEIKVVGPQCPELIKEWLELPWSDASRTIEAEGFDNHCADAALYVWRKCNSFQRPIVRAGSIRGSYTS